jgi:hypothetical protein
MKINQIMIYYKIYFVHPSLVVVTKNQTHTIGKKKPVVSKMNKILLPLLNNHRRHHKFYPVSIIKFPRMFLLQKHLPFIIDLISRDMTKAVMTAQPSGAMNTRQQATEADAVDERYKPAKQTSIISDSSPRRGVQKSLERNARRSATVAPPPNTTEKDLSLSKQPRTPLTTAQISELSQRLKHPSTSKSSAGEPLTTNNKLIGKEDSPASASHSDSAKAKNGIQNRSSQLKTSEILNVDEPPSPAIIMYTSTGGIEHGKPPKTPRSFRTTATNRSDALALTRQTTTTTRGGDSEAMSIPAGTFAIKVGPQTVMSQWIISLNDNLDDEGSDNQHSAKWEDAQEKLQRFETETIEILDIFLLL